MDDKRRVKLSKYLSKVLRHDPSKLGLSLAPGGWVEIDDLLAACARNQFEITRLELEEVVATSDKQRFAIDDSLTRIRANQGHSVKVDLQLAPLEPPSILFHGTGQQSAEIIRAEGLKKMSRHHVHLSADLVTARKVGARHGNPSVFVINAAAMYQDGFSFYRSANGVWLVDHVPPSYLSESATSHEDSPTPRT
ncbi:MAG TPA: RNA 2'-phosphotransferase [Aggregatilineales bacterium]|nr:RNA 2'-phosphotransferase [Aggregatilineales bacterium]